MADQQRFEMEPTQKGPVECLGMTFESDDARRSYFQERLREKLQDPEFRKIPGFPKGTDGDILRMSDPPYYTACPNPFLTEFVRVYGRPHDPSEQYRREPFAVDVSVGKTDALYKAHSYHTKVPHLAILPSILHYTKPGDLVLDGFSGSGQTGTAAQWCGKEDAALRHRIEQHFAALGYSKPEWGTRRAILNDLSPIASYITANYNLPFHANRFLEVATRLLKKVDSELGWMYRTRAENGVDFGTINYTVWSEVFICPECSQELIFSKVALEPDEKTIRATFNCHSCGAELGKRDLERVMETVFDHDLGHAIRVPKRVPYLIRYTVGKQSFEKRPDAEDLRVLDRIATLPFLPGIPRTRMMHASDGVDKWGDKWRAGTASFSHVHHLFLARQAHALSLLWKLAQETSDDDDRRMLLFFVEQAVWGMSVLARYAPTHFSQVNQYLSGVYYIGSQIAECSPSYVLGGKLNRLAKAMSENCTLQGAAAITVGDAGNIPLPDDSIDYIFTDPPFGSNFAYAELNFLLESFHRVFTNTSNEAIVSPAQAKGIYEYQGLMRTCFEEYHRLLKPGRWMTVVFSNSSNAVWRAIQEAIAAAGFVVADVQTLDKKQGSFNQVHGVTVKQDLIITAYKPSTDVGKALQLGLSPEESAWRFVAEHLAQIPVALGTPETVVGNIERVPQMLLDRMIGFHVQRGLSVPISSGEFFRGLDQRCTYRDGMYFLAEQASIYDRRKAKAKNIQQLSLNISDEASAILWIRLEIDKHPQSFQVLQPTFMRASQAWSNNHEKQVELKEILEENFLLYDGSGQVPTQIHTYLSTNFKDMRGLSKDDPVLKAKAADRWYVPDPNKQSDLDQLRVKRLLKEFQECKESKQKKLKLFRTEAVRAGFKAAYDQKDYRTIVDVARKLPEQVIQEDEKLLMYYDVASMRLGED